MFSNIKVNNKIPKISIKRFLIDNFLFLNNLISRQKMIENITEINALLEPEARIDNALGIQKINKFLFFCLLSLKGKNKVDIKTIAATKAK